MSSALSDVIDRQSERIQELQSENSGLRSDRAEWARRMGEEADASSERIEVLESALDRADRLQESAWNLACKAREHKPDSAHSQNVFLASSQYDRARAATQTDGQKGDIDYE